jgi:pseudaminic acid cytidylyltransferase
MDNKLAIIPARGGSKRIPRKNIKPFLDQPIIKYSIDAAINSNLFDEIIVSTDDDEIARIALSCGAKVPFIRSEATSNDYASTVDVLEEVFAEYKKIGKTFEYCCCLYPAAPLISPQNLMKGFEILKESDADSVVPVVRFSYPIQRALKIEKRRLFMMWPDNTSLRSQDLTSAYHDAGEFYWCRVKNLLLHKQIFTENTVPMELSELEAQDIDNEEDWKIAEIKYKILMDSK